MPPSEDASVPLSRTNISNVPSSMHFSIKKPKTKGTRTTCCLDPRTELTDDELKVSGLPRKDSKDLFYKDQTARAQYLKYQEELKSNKNKKKLEQDGEKLIRDAVLQPPLGSQFSTRLDLLTIDRLIPVRAADLADFWNKSVYAQIESRMAIRFHSAGAGEG
jgi:hypothetical protein